MVSLYFVVKEGSGRSAQGKTPNSFLNRVRKNTSALPSLEAEVIMNMTNYNIGEGDGRHPTPVLLPGKSHGWRSVVGCSPWDFPGKSTGVGCHCLGSGIILSREKFLLLSIHDFCWCAKMLTNDTQLTITYLLVLSVGK